MRGLSFRLITYVEMKLTDPIQRDELFERYSKEKPRIFINSMPGDLARAIVSKENAVRKGVNTIYFAIHRNKRVSVIPTTELTQIIRKLNCPNHPEIEGENQCPLDCVYLIPFLQDFEKDMPPELAEIPLREYWGILGESGNLIKRSGKYTNTYNDNDNDNDIDNDIDIEEPEE